MPKGIYPRKLATPEEILNRFLERVHFTDYGCWEWTGAMASNGYGTFHVPGTKSNVTRSHEFSYHLFVGPVPDGLELDHLCHNPKCINPDHLEPVTHQENMTRGLLFNSNRGNCLKTHCIHGHPFDELNTYVGKDGHRHCKTCVKNRSVRYALLKQRTVNSDGQS